MNKYFNPKLIKRHKRYNILISARDYGKSYYLLSKLRKKRNSLIIRKECK